MLREESQLSEQSRKLMPNPDRLERNPPRLSRCLNAQKVILNTIFPRNFDFGTFEWWTEQETMCRGCS